MISPQNLLHFRSENSHQCEDMVLHIHKPGRETFHADLLEGFFLVNHLEHIAVLAREVLFDLFDFFAKISVERYLLSLIAQCLLHLCDGVARWRRCFWSRHCVAGAGDVGVCVGVGVEEVGRVDK
ncbi:uncharacterized protein MYCFIDRAFT_200472 [Pseudocercospora fijiensis CIRAD86]|uniref:Uncharacterized protein n=1 Tax=Pseudocercospora fijiensis (strain CIRAD86) TaxID=383855 RepID=M2ZG94_PSEFD|nr:uncharacterized protein MYCFIDRAFT_200472 [Pseudocercospora fijiensis CIRAD86]EME78159.1 hypothetical protein MYCFIDRAFT_200472 [Pseudocercospora fijiensis CIRAD86]